MSEVIKIGDSVEFLSFYGSSKWEADFGVDVGDVVVVDGLCDDGRVMFRTKTNQLIRVHSSQVAKYTPKLEATKEIIASQNESIKKTLYSPLTVQQAGDHYKKKGIQPIEYGLANNLSFPQVNVVKYITRHEDKNGLDDLAKSIHYHFFEALRVYGEEGTHELRNKVLSLLGIEQGVFK